MESDLQDYLQRYKVYDIVQDMIYELGFHRPKDVVKFMVAFLQDKYQSGQGAVTTNKDSAKKSPDRENNPLKKKNTKEDDAPRKQFIEASKAPSASTLKCVREPGEWPLMKSLGKADKGNLNVLMLGIDGCRPDVLMMHASRLRSVMLKGASSMALKSPYSSVSGPGWATILSGTMPTSHGIVDQSFTSFIQDEERDGAAPGMFFDTDDTNSVVFTAWEELGGWITNGGEGRVRWQQSQELHAIGAGKSTKSLTVQYKYLYNGNEDRPMAVSNDEVVKDASGWLNREVEPNMRNFCFVHLMDLNHVGYFSGYGPYVKSYVDAMMETDEQIGKLLDVVDKRVREGEHWRIVAVTDHGGSTKKFLAPVQKQALLIRNRNKAQEQHQIRDEDEDEEAHQSSTSIKHLLTEATLGAHSLPVSQDASSFVMVYDSDPSLVEAGEIYPEPQFHDIPFFCGYDLHLAKLQDDENDKGLHPAEVQRQTKLTYDLPDYFS